MSVVPNKYQVPGKLFKKLGTESQSQPHQQQQQQVSQNERSSSFRTSASFRASFSAGKNFLSPRSLRNKSKLETQLSTSSSLMMNIPRLVRDCVEFIQENDRDKTEGLFRIPGDTDKIDKMLSLYETTLNEEEENRRGFSASDDSEDLFAKHEATVHDVASLMKRFLMKNAASLIQDQPKKDMISLVENYKQKDEQEQEHQQQFVAYQVVLKCLEIPEDHRVCLGYVLKFLLMISSGDMEDGSRMTVESLAKMFAPIIMRESSSNAVNNSSSSSILEDQMKYIENAIVVTEILIWNAMEILPANRG